jgi:hypothetical protein
MEAPSSMLPVGASFWCRWRLVWLELERRGFYHVTGDGYQRHGIAGFGDGRALIVLLTTSS